MTADGHPHPLPGQLWRRRFSAGDICVNGFELAAGNAVFIVSVLDANDHQSHRGRARRVVLLGVDGKLGKLGKIIFVYDWWERL